MKIPFLKENLSDYLLLSIIIALPFSIKLTNYLIITLVSLLLISFISGSIKFKKGQLIPLIINTGPIIFITCTLLYCNDLRAGIHAMDKFLPLFIFPLIFSVASEKKSPYFFCNGFAIAVLTISIICICFAFYQSYFTPVDEQPLIGDLYNRVPSRWNTFSNTNLMRPFVINPIYMSLYVSFSIVCLYFFDELGSWFRILSILFLIMFELLIGSRIGLLAFGVCLMILPLYIQSKRLKIIHCACIVVLASLSLILVAINPVLTKRHITDLKSMSIPHDVSGWNALNIRLAIWKCSFQSFLESPFYGYGAGSQSHQRELCYKNYSFYGPYGTDLNSHNQYFEYALIGGIILLVLFIIQLLYSLKIFTSTKQVMPIVFLILVMITFLGESVLETHKGIVFFSYFNSLFLFRSSNGNISLSQR